MQSGKTVSFQREQSMQPGLLFFTLFFSFRRFAVEKKMLLKIVNGLLYSHRKISISPYSLTKFHSLKSITDSPYNNRSFSGLFGRNRKIFPISAGKTRKVTIAYTLGWTYSSPPFSASFPPPPAPALDPPHLCFRHMMTPHFFL